MITLISHRSLSGSYGSIPADYVFEVDEKTAESLEARGLASRYRKPPANGIAAKMEHLYENKMLDTQDVKSFMPVEPVGVGAPVVAPQPFPFRRPGRPRKSP